MSIMFTKHSRFADLQKKLEVVKREKSKFLTVLVLVMSMSSLPRLIITTMMKMEAMLIM
jgi:hypothetical protein